MIYEEAVLSIGEDVICNHPYYGGFKGVLMPEIIHNKDGSYSARLQMPRGEVMQFRLQDVHKVKK